MSKRWYSYQFSTEDVGLTIAIFALVVLTLAGIDLPYVSTRELLTISIVFLVLRAILPQKWIVVVAFVVLILMLLNTLSILVFPFVPLLILVLILMLLMGMFSR